MEPPVFYSSHPQEAALDRGGMCLKARCALHSVHLESHRRPIPNHSSATIQHLPCFGEKIQVFIWCLAVFAGVLMKSISVAVYIYKMLKNQK